MLRHVKSIFYMAGIKFQIREENNGWMHAADKNCFILMGSSKLFSEVVTLKFCTTLPSPIMYLELWKMYHCPIFVGNNRTDPKIAKIDFFIAILLGPNYLYEVAGNPNKVCRVGSPH